MGVDIITDLMKKKQEVWSRFTKYEIARILGARALQLAMNAPMLLKLDKEQLEQLSYDPLKIAELELYSGILPITVRRPLPERKQEMPREEAKEPVKKEAGQKGKEQKGKEKAKAEEKAPETEKKVSDKEKIEVVKAEEEIKEIAEEAEIMELAKPEDEIEEVSGGTESEIE